MAGEIEKGLQGVAGKIEKGLQGVARELEKGDSWCEVPAPCICLVINCFVW